MDSKHSTTVYYNFVIHDYDTQQVVNGEFILICAEV